MSTEDARSAASYALAKQLPSAHSVESSYGAFTLDDEMRVSVGLALTPILRRLAGILPERLLNPADVELLRDALDHIMRTARASRTQTRRTRFIEKRAKLALDGVPYSPRDFDLPKMTPVQTALDTAKRQNMALRFNYREMLGALRDAESFISGFEDDQSQVGIPELLERLRAALNLATAACHQEVAA